MARIDPIVWAERERTIAAALRSMKLSLRSRRGAAGETKKEAKQRLEMKRRATRLYSVKALLHGKIHGNADVQLSVSAEQHPAICEQLVRIESKLNEIETEDRQLRDMLEQVSQRRMQLAVKRDRLADTKLRLYVAANKDHLLDELGALEPGVVKLSVDDCTKKLLDILDGQSVP